MTPAKGPEPGPSGGDSAGRNCQRRSDAVAVVPHASMLGVMKGAVAMALVVTLAACASPRGNDTFGKWSLPTVRWNGVGSVTLPMDTISMDGRIVFYVVELSINGNRSLFLVDSGSSSTLFTREFASS